MRKCLERFFTYVFIVFGLVSSTYADTLTSVSQWSFDDLLKEGGLSYQAPKGWKETDKAYAAVPSNKVLVMPDGSAELHYLIRPISLMGIDYDDPHGSAPNPNEVFPLLFESLTESLSDHSGTYQREYTVNQARDNFNAEWAAASVFTLKDEVSQVYEEGFLIAMHSHNKADAYLLVLVNDVANLKEIMADVTPGLVFEQ